MPSARENGCHALRHHFASVLLYGGTDIKAPWEYLGYLAAGFTLRTYVHLVPATHDPMRAAIDAARTEAGLATAQGGTDDRLGR